MSHATLPGWTAAGVQRVLTRDLDTSGGLAGEVTVVVDAFLDAAWGELRGPAPGAESASEAANATALADLDDEVVPGVAASAQYVALQYTISVLWGYALRGLV